VADPAETPGIKLWSYGLGHHEIWAKAGSINGQAYVEIQGGPTRDQSIKALLQPGEIHSHTEFWIPTSVPWDIRTLRPPQPILAAREKVPWFDWPSRPTVQFWRAVLQAHARNAPAELPAPPGLDQNLWAPSGMETLEEALPWACTRTSGTERDGWRFQFGTWLAAVGRTDQAFGALTSSQDDRAHAVAARLLWREKKDAAGAAACYRQIQTEAVACHPQVVFERDLVLSALGRETWAEREQWLGRLSSIQDEWVLERRAALLLDRGDAAAAKVLLETTPFQLVHQRYERTRLWQRIKKQLGLEQPDPANWLGEDDLATFGAYREFE
jgi:hypothetical protein